MKSRPRSVWPRTGQTSCPPRLRDEALLSPGLIWHITLVSTLILVAVFGIYAYAVDRGHSQMLARTLAMNTLVALEMFHLFFIRNIYRAALTSAAVCGTRVVWTCVLAMVGAQIAITYVPLLQQIFGTVAVPLLEWGPVFGIGVVFFALIETEKQMRLALRATGAAAG